MVRKCTVGFLLTQEERPAADVLLEDEAEDGGEEVGDADDERAVRRVDRAPRLLEDQLREERHRALQRDERRPD